MVKFTIRMFSVSLKHLKSLFAHLMFWSGMFIETN